MGPLFFDKEVRSDACGPFVLVTLLWALGCPEPVGCPAVSLPSDIEKLQNESNLVLRSLGEGISVFAVPTPNEYGVPFPPFSLLL